MKLKDIIKNLDKSESNETGFDWQSLAYEFNIQDLDWSNCTRLKCYEIATHLCTDTHVGLRAYFLDDTLVGVSCQRARKSGITYSFVEGMVDPLNDYLHSLLGKEEVEVDFLDLESEAMPYTVRYAEQLICKNVIYKGELVEYSKCRESYINDTILIGDEEVDVKDVVIPFKLKDL